MRISPRNGPSILMLHTTITDIVSNIDMNSIDKKELPAADYYAMGHIHQRYNTTENNRHYVYPGPTFPNNFQELVDLENGSFQITEITDKINTINVKVPIKDVAYIEIELENGLTATEEIIERINKSNLKDKILLLKLKGTLNVGKSGDIKFNEIEEFINKKEVYSYLRNISQIKTKDSDVKFSQNNIEEVGEIEKIIQEEFSKENPHDFNKYLPQLMSILALEKSEEEKSSAFETRLIEELKERLKLENAL